MNSSLIKGKDDVDLASRDGKQIEIVPSGSYDIDTTTVAAVPGKYVINEQVNSVQSILKKGVHF